MTDLLTRLLALAELAVDAALQFDYGDPEDRHIWRELQELKPLVQQALGERPSWTPVADALPDTTKKVLASYLNKLGKRRIVIANWVQARTQESAWDDEELDITEYDESSEEFFLKEGWYECIENNEEYGMYWIYEGVVTHWMPMPQSPGSLTTTTETP